MAIDKVTSAAITDGTITSSDLASGAVQNQSAFKNIIINGDMSQAQRSTSETGITGAGYATLDRFRLGGSVPGTWTWSQSTTVPTGQGFAKSMKIDCTTAECSLGASDTMYFQHKIEGQNLQYLKKGTSSAESLTLSFWVRSAKTGTYIAMLFDNDNNRHISKSYTISSADTWEKKTITYDGDTTGAFDNDNASSLEVWLWLAAGSNNSSGTLATSWASTTNANNAVGQVNLADSTSNDFYITGIQLEAGTSASDFEFLPHDVNRDRCERYYTTGAARAEGYRGTAGVVKSMINFRKTMRSSPSISHSSIGNDNVGSYSNEITSDGFGYKIVSSTSGNTYQNSTYAANAEL